jgi:hypothetical protein
VLPDWRSGVRRENVVAHVHQRRDAPAIDQLEGLDRLQSSDPVNGASDTSGAAGSSEYVEMINRAIGIFDKSTGRLVCPPMPSNAPWHGASGPGRCSVTRSTDGIAEFDSHARRWLFYLPSSEKPSRKGELPRSGVCLAISKTADPTGGYYRYRFPVALMTPNIPWHGDYEKDGIWPTAYTYASRARNTSTGKGLFYGMFIAGLNRRAMLRGLPFKLVEFFVPEKAPVKSPSFYIFPANWDGTTAPPAGEDAPYVETFNTATGRHLGVWSLRAKFANPARSTFTRVATPPTQPYNTYVCGDPTTFGACVQQPSVPNKAVPALQPLAAGLPMQRVVYRNFAHRETLLVNFTVVAGAAGNSGISWYELRRSGRHGRWHTYQQGTYAPDSDYRWLGSMAMDKLGDLAIGFDVSGPTTFPTIRYTGRLASDRHSTLRQEATLVDGRGSQLGIHTFGDYAQMTVDPTDDCTFWFASTYYASQGADDQHDFSTRIGAFRFRSCR